MPVRSHKNTAYGLMLPLLGRRCRWKRARTEGAADGRTGRAVERAWKRHRTVGGCVQVIRGGRLGERYIAGFARLDPPQPVAADTVFRTASVAKAVCALLVMRLQTLGKLSVEEDISDFWRRPIRNPHFPGAKIPLGSLLGHTSGLADTPRYFRSFEEEITADELLRDEASYAPHLPYRHFRYSNFGAGLVGSLLEHRFGISFEGLMQRELFGPLGVRATFDIRTLDIARVADGYRVLPAGKAPAFDARARLQTAPFLDAPDPQRHFLLASGNLFLTAEEMGKLCLLAMTGAHNGEAFLDAESLALLRSFDPGLPAKPGLRPGMGLFVLEDRRVSPRRLYGHQGFAYGAVNGFFFDDGGNGFVSLNSGASEKRAGRLSCLNRDLIRAVWED